MSKILVSLIALICSASALSFTRDSNAEKVNITVGVSDSREAAYQLGQRFASDLKGESPRQLKRTLGIYEYGLNANTIKVHHSQIGIDEFSTASGEIKYRAVVNVNYSYNKFEADNR